MPRKHKPKRKPPQPSRLEKAQAWFSYLAREYKAIGIRMVEARLEFLEADAEERAKMHLEYPDDEVIKHAAEQAAQDLHDWNVKMGRVTEIEETHEEAVEASNRAIEIAAAATEHAIIESDDKTIETVG